ncbi:hypothetical protein MUO69_04615, partial [Candidatus Bathyarchaeota archaeon]|nr:hypothetical protein [Candidatus Bathyarchaeota archaeon]
MMNPGSYQVGYLGLVNCVNMTVEGLDLVSNVDGLMLANTNDSRVAMNSCCDINKDGKIQYLDLGILLAPITASKEQEG